MFGSNLGVLWVKHQYGMFGRRYEQTGDEDLRYGVS